MYSSITLDKSVRPFSYELWKILLFVFILFLSLASKPLGKNDHQIATYSGLIKNANLFLKKTDYIIKDVPIVKYVNVAYLNRVTAYNAIANQTSSHPWLAACGPNLPRHQVALSQNLFIRPNGTTRCGQQVLIRLNDGRTVKGVVWDTMNARYHNAADILMKQYGRAMQFGIKQGSLTFIYHKYENISFNKFINT